MGGLGKDWLRGVGGGCTVSGPSPPPPVSPLGGHITSCDTTSPLSLPPLGFVPVTPCILLTLLTLLSFLTLLTLVTLHGTRGPPSAGCLFEASGHHGAVPPPDTPAGVPHHLCAWGLGPDG
jgi:hypothetical protein